MMEIVVKPSKLINNVAYFTFSQAVSILPFSRRTLQRKMARREIQFLSCGKLKFFRPDDIDAFLEKNMIKPKKAFKKEM